MSTNKFICIAPIETDCGGSRIEIGVEVVPETDDAIPEAQIKVEDEEVAPTACVFLAEHVEPEEIRACRVCLLMDCRLYSMEQCDIKDMFKKITGLQLLDDYPWCLCAECATFLVKCKRFREKSMIVQKILDVLSNPTCTVKIEDIFRQVDRNLKKLSSGLSVKQNSPNHIDLYMSEDLEEESPTDFKRKELARDSITLASNNFDTDIYECEDDKEEKEDEIPTSVKGDKIKTALTNGCEANSAKREYMKLSSNSLVKQNHLHNFDSDIYVDEDDEEETPTTIINDKEIKTELENDNEKTLSKRELLKSNSKLSGKKNPTFFSDTPHITYTYEDYEKNTLTTLNDNINNMFSDSDENDNDKISTQTNLELAEVKHSKKSVDGSKAATKTEESSEKKVYNCEQCDKVFKSKSVYLEHLRLEHHSSQHVCCICGLSFVCQIGVKVHQSRMHLMDNSEIPVNGPCCAECSLTFLSKGALQRQGLKKLEFGKDLIAEDSDSSENEEYLKSEFESDGEDTEYDEKARTETIIMSLPNQRFNSRDVLLDRRRILKNMIVVKKLTLEEQLEVIQRRKEKNKDKAYKCDICSFGSHLKEGLEVHIMRHSEEMGQLSCNLCHVRFKTRRAYSQHEHLHRYMYSCVECPFTTYQRNIASAHVKEVHEKKKFTCDKCGNVYRSAGGYYQHRKMKHPSPQHVCCLCGYAFVNKMGLVTHHNAKHLQDSVAMPTLADGPSCAECSLRFMNEKALQTHMRVSHTTGTSKMSNCAFDLSHRRRKVVCETCGKLVNANILKYHLEEHAGKTFSCPICGKAYAKRACMLQHKYIFHNKGGKNEYKQKVPSRTECGVCKKTFSYGNVKKHMDRAHSGNIIPCSFCDKTFSSSENLKQHVDHVHLKKPWYKKRAK